MPLPSYQPMQLGQQPSGGSGSQNITDWDAHGGLQVGTLTGTSDRNAAMGGVNGLITNLRTQQMPSYLSQAAQGMSAQGSAARGIGGPLAQSLQAQAGGNVAAQWEQNRLSNLSSLYNMQYGQGQQAMDQDYQVKLAQYQAMMGQMQANYNNGSSMYGMVGGALGGAVGTMYGGPAGGMAGASLGSAAGRGFYGLTG